jgi:hypothetical protein
MRRPMFFILSLVILSSCVEARDYFGANSGAVGLDIKKQFGEGKAVKDYYVTEDRIGLIKNDTKNEVSAKIGYPSSITTTLDGDECWIYEKRGLRLCFDGDRLDSWKEIENK